METIVCDLCGQSKSEPYQQLTDRFTGDSFELVRCTNCQLIYLNPRPLEIEMGRYYPAAYEPHSVGESAAAQWHDQRMRQIQLHFVQRFAQPPGKLLDIGCATGEFLVTARSKGWQVQGIELVPEAAEAARSRHGLTVTTGTAENQLQGDEQLDIITMWDVVEHLRQPKVVFARCWKALKPNGWLVFAIPNIDSFDRQLFGGTWVGWEAPRHLYFFDKVTLPRLLQETGFVQRDADCLVGGRGVFQMSLATAVQRTRWERLVKLIMNPLLTSLWPYRQLSYRLNKGSVMTFAVQRVAT